MKFLIIIITIITNQITKQILQIAENSKTSITIPEKILSGALTCANISKISNTSSQKNNKTIPQNNQEEEIIDTDEDFSEFTNEKTQNFQTNNFKPDAYFRGNTDSSLKQDRVLENGLEDATEFYNSLFLETEYHYSSTTTIKLSTRFKWQYLIERNENDNYYYIFNGENPKSLFEYEIEESYIDFKNRSFNFRVGYQYFKWGENLAYSRSDIINPIDIKDSVIPAIDKRKVPVFAVISKYFYKDILSLTVSIIPFRRNPKISYWGRDFSILQPSINSDTSIINNFISPTIESDIQNIMTTQDQKKDFTESSIAVNFSFSTGKLNTSLVYYYGYQELPQMTFEKDFKKLLFYMMSGKTERELLLPLYSSVMNKYLGGEELFISKFTRYNHFALSFSYPISSFIIKSDVSYSPDKMFYTDINTDDADKFNNSFIPLYKKYLAYTFGIEYQYSRNFVFDFEFFGSRILNDQKENYFYASKNQAGIFSMLKWEFAKDEYSILLLGNYEIFFKDYLAKIELTKHIKEMDIYIGYNHFGGKKNTPIGRFDNNDEFFLGIKYWY